MKLKFLLATCLTALPLSVLAGDTQAPSAAEVWNQNTSCFRCHAFGRTKSGPSWEAISRKWKNKPDAKDKLLAYITSSHKMVDGGGDPIVHEPLYSTHPDSAKIMVDDILSEDSY